MERKSDATTRTPAQPQKQLSSQEQYKVMSEFLDEGIQMRDTAKEDMENWKRKHPNWSEDDP